MVWLARLCVEVGQNTRDTCIFAFVHIIDPLEAWELYLRKAANDRAQGKQRTPPREWASTFARRLDTYKRLWNGELGDYVPGAIPSFASVERQLKRQLGPVVAAANRLAL